MSVFLLLTTASTSPYLVIRSLHSDTLKARSSNQSLYFAKDLMKWVFHWFFFLVHPFRWWITEPLVISICPIHYVLGGCATASNDIWLTIMRAALSCMCAESWLVLPAKIHISTFKKFFIVCLSLSTHKHLTSFYLCHFILLIMIKALPTAVCSPL